jgi:oligopeptide transport system substrate-binding protein
MRRHTASARFALLLLVGLLATAGLAPVPAAASATAPARLGQAVRQAGTSEVHLPLSEPPTLDPGLAEEGSAIEVVSQLFDGLVSLEPSGGVSGLGAESWSISPDGTTYTFTLRAGRTWTDGRPVTADDYAYAWRRNVDPATASPYANALFPVKNAQAINDGELPPDQLGVRAVDDRTLVVTLEQPAAYFLSLASTWTLYPLRRDVVEANGDDWTDPGTIVTNGPYLLTAWEHDSRIVLDRNPSYGGPPPSIARATFHLFPSEGSEQMLAAYEAGEIDTTGAGVPSELPPSQIDRILADPVLSGQVRSIKQSSTELIIVNHRRPHLQDPRVRQALGMALDRTLILDAVLKRAGEPAYGIQPEGIVGRQPSLWPRDDAAMAQQLMADAGYPNGAGFPEITYTFNSSAELRILAEYLQARWKETLGVNVRLESMERRVFLPWRRGEEWNARGDLYRASWFSDYEDPNNWYNLLWESSSDPTSFNGAWKDAGFDALVRRGASEQDAARRAGIYGQAEAIMAREYPHIPLFHYDVRSLVKPYVRGYAPSRVLGITPLRTMSLDAR